MNKLRGSLFLLLYFCHGLGAKEYVCTVQEKIFSLLELPALITAVVFGFLTAAEFRGGMLGRGMKYLAAGFLIMGLNHLHLQLISSFRFDLLFEIFGDWGANIAWFTLLIGSWLLLAAGFAELYRSGK